MDEQERVGQIREGAGQVESKLNVEFIDWLRKWHMPILLVVAVVALGWVGFQRWEQMKKARVARAFSELDAATSPEVLRTLAGEYEGVRSVPLLARLRAADAYLEAARRGVRPGAQPDAQTGQFAPENLLSTGDVDTTLDQAEALYKEVLGAVGDNQSKAIFGVNAAFGVAAVRESKGDLDGAKKAYEEVVRIAEWGAYPEQAGIARKRIEELPKLAEPVKVYAAAELPKPPEPPPGPVGPEGAAPSPGVFDPSTVLPPGEAAAPAGEQPQTPPPPPPPPGEPVPAGEPPANPPAEPPAPAPGPP